jgi:hypothetical protein
MRGRMFLALTLFAGLALPCWGQIERCEGTIETVHRYPNAVYPAYTSEYKVSMHQLQKDGITKTSKFTEVDAHDSQGRWMSSKTFVPSTEEDSEITQVCVYDPIAGVKITWSVPGAEATQMKIAELESLHSVCPKNDKTHPEISLSKPVVEDLGIKTIEGYEAHGFRTSRGIPTPASASGKSNVRRVEKWIAFVPGVNGLAGLELTDDHLDNPWAWNKAEQMKILGDNPPESLTMERGLGGLIVSEVLDDPRVGRRWLKLQDFSAGDPNPTFFQSPPGYEIVNKKATSACSDEETATRTEPSSPPER